MSEQKCCKCDSKIDVEPYCNLCIHNLITESYFKGANMANKSIKTKVKK